MKAAVALTLLLAAALDAASARADDKSICLAAVSEGQALRLQHKLIEAHEKFHACAASSCPPILQRDCTGFMIDTEKATPTVVLAAKDGGGNDVFDVRVTLDGAPLATKLDGDAVAVDPGARTFTFHFPDGTSIDRQVLVAEGQKARVVSVALAPPAAQALTPPVAAPSPSSPPSPSGGGLRTAGFVVGGAGVATLVVGGVLGGLALSKVNAAKSACGASRGGCADNTSASAVSEMGTAGTYADGSTGLFIAGGALVAGGITMVLVGRPASGATALHVAPVVTARGGSLGLTYDF